MFTKEAKKKQIPESSKHEGASQWLNLSSPVIFPDQKENLESSGEILWHEILHEILADCSVWVPVCGLGHVNYVRARIDGRGAPYSVRSSTGGGSTALHSGEWDPFVPCGAVTSQTRPLQLDRAAGATLVLSYIQQLHEQTFNRDSIAKYKGVKRKANNIKCSVR